MDRGIWANVPTPWWTMCTSRGWYSPLMWCSEGVCMWNWTSWKSEPATVVVPLTMTSIVVPRFSNSTSCSGMLILGFSVMTVTESSVWWLVSNSRIGSCDVEHTNVNGGLVCSSFACLVLNSEGSPVERSIEGSVAECIDLDAALCGLCSLLESGQSMETSC